MIQKLMSSSLKLGIIAGGQLGKMLIQEASRWAIATYVLDPDPDCPAKRVATGHTIGDFRDFDTVYQFGTQVDLLTYEMENINIDALRKLRDDGYVVLPDPDVLALIQDKGLQKAFYQDYDIPTASFRVFDHADAIRKAIAEGHLRYPFVQKLRRGGYDGRGVALIRSNDDTLFDGESIVEDAVAIDKEIAVIVARNKGGEIAVYPVVEMRFDAKNHLVEDLFCPASVSQEVEEEVCSIASKIIEKLKMEGLLAVEFFIDKNGRLLVNEMAPRPHNSGHHTIDSIMTSQHEQLLRAILGLPLGSTKMVMPSVMVNLLGEEGYNGRVCYEGLTEVLGMSGAYVHLYGKRETRPARKMGHVTIVAPTLEDAFRKAQRVKKTIKVKSCQIPR